MQANYTSPSQSPFGGFGFSGGWGGSGVWAPNSSTGSGSGGTSPAGAHGLQVTFHSFIEALFGNKPINLVNLFRKRHRKIKSVCDSIRPWLIQFHIYMSVKLLVFEVKVQDKTPISMQPFCAGRYQDR